MRGCYLPFLLLLLGLLSCNATKLGSSFDLRTHSKVRCIEEERQALLQFKQHLVDRSHWLSSWDSGTKDCCKWEGIKCSNKTGHVVKLDLQADWLCGVELATKYLEGEISSSLLGLQYLTYLDLSCNDFSGKSFPNFVGSLAKLQHLNLSYTQIAGTIPQQLGNLSGLISLDLDSDYDLMEAHNLDWLIHLSSLTYLDMSGVNLSQVVKWPNKVMMLPSLTHLSLSYCSLSKTTPQLLSTNTSFSSQLLFLDLSYNYDLIEAHNLVWLTHFSSLTYLDMSGVNLSQVVKWPNKVMMLPSLTHLSLRHCSLSKTTPQLLSTNVSFSSQLLFLDLSYNYDLTEAHNLDWLTHFSSLTYLDMSGVNLSQVVKWPNKVMMLPSLTHLSLRHCSLSKTTPQLLSTNVSFSSQLLFLDLSYNYDLTEAHNLDWLTHFSSLTYLDMSGVNLSQVVNWPNKVMMLPSLTHLSLSYCSLSKMTPQLLSINTSFSSQLQFLYLSGNHLNCSIFLWLFNFTTSLVNLELDYNELQCSIPDAFGSISSLRTLYLSENKFFGGIPKSFMNLCSLDSLTLSYNSLSGNLYEFMSNASGCLMDSLQSFDISHNRFTGLLPESIGNLSNLYSLDVSMNSLAGVITEAHFSNLHKLKYLNLGPNSLILRFSYDWIPPFQLDAIALSSCKLGSAFPKWIQSQKNYYMLDISNAGISDIIPAWFWDFPPELDYLDLSNNELHGNLSNLSSSRFGEYALIDLSANLFDGSVPPFPSNVISLDLSNNRFSGSISFLCKINTSTLLGSLNLSNNTLSGELPDCWTHFHDLVVLNLANNNFYGKIPDSMGSLVSIQLLHLSNNGFVGKIPMFLHNCSKLITIDLGANHLSGMVPPWIGNSLQNLIILNLRSNMLYGSLPLSLCLLSRIQILDISLNKIEGTIPKCIKNLTAMSLANKQFSGIYTNSSRRSYQDHVSLVWKGREFLFESSLGLLNIIDLSSNKLHGEVPDGITNLTGLKSLNLSRNNLTGLIAQKIGLLGNLESLDLSRNQLCGEIPMSISNISFLSQLDLSTNNLSGKIPTGTQIQSFNASAFLGNPKLCGSPLPNKCIEDLTLHKNQNVQENDDDGFITKGFYVAATLGFIGGFWGVCFISVLKIRYIMKRLTSNA
ncbi:hypothetical protein I3842_05G203800 [Carya illinoinensis]|uniref:Leucine-rich repeat-containing N-terminal plant-type domain-containing protein n=1 Tax=Carya illinoinensis TaxID=32201 RepID=A0A922F360_CARIL|nr:hypothetical protein I3842_05G203800 [Carya illinoinensis]